jgi:pimeloyl-ACP methyl ester carboxylesterase
MVRKRKIVDPVIVIPGVTATYLWDEYPIPPEYVWKVLGFSKKYKRVALHPNNLKYEAKEPARLQPGQLYEIAYEEIIEELRYNLSRTEDEPVPVYPFTYDWRMNLDQIENQLGNFIEEVIDRTKLLTHYHLDGYDNSAKVNLVGHSMGGLIIAGYLEKKGRKGEAAPVNKVVSLASPFQGSFETIVQVTTGNANFGMSAPSSREREAARLTPSLYHLLPSFKQGIVYHPDFPKSLFNPDVWQPSITESLSEWIRLNGLPIKGKTEKEVEEKRRKLALKLLGDLLQEANKHRLRINKLNLKDAGLTPDRWLAVVGVDAETRVHIEIKKRGKNPEFYFDADEDLKNNWGKKKLPIQEQRQTGDGTVPFEGAIPNFLNLENLVCVTPDDYEFWELKDKGLTKIGGFHGILPNMNMLHRLIARFFKNAPDRRKNTWGLPAPGVDPDTEWKPPLDLKPRKK